MYFLIFIILSGIFVADQADLKGKENPSVWFFYGVFLPGISMIHAICMKSEIGGKKFYRKPAKPVQIDSKYYQKIPRSELCGNNSSYRKKYYKPSGQLYKKHDEYSDLSSKYHEKIPRSELCGNKSTKTNNSTSQKRRIPVTEDKSVGSNHHAPHKVRIIIEREQAEERKKEKDMQARQREDFEKIQSEYLKAERLKNEAELERQKEKIARETAEAEKESARLERKKAEAIQKNAANEWEKAKKNINAPKNEMSDPYSVLGVHKNDSLETIKDVYKKLIQIYHPDKYAQSNDTAKQQKNDKTTRINAAYDWIKKHHGHA